MFPWGSVGTLLPLLLGAAVLMLWATYSYKFSANPMIPLVVIKDRTAAVSYFGTFVHGLTVSLCVVFYSMSELTVGSNLALYTIFRSITKVSRVTLRL